MIEKINALIRDAKNAQIKLRQLADEANMLEEELKTNGIFIPFSKVILENKEFQFTLSWQNNPHRNKKQYDLMLKRCDMNGNVVEFKRFHDFSIDIKETIFPLIPLFIDGFNTYVLELDKRTTNQLLNGK